MAALPIGVADDGFALKRADGDGKRVGRRGRGNADHVPGGLRKLFQQRQCGHAAHTGPDDTMQLLYAKVLYHLPTAGGDVFDAEFGKIQPPGLAAGRVQRVRSGGAETTAQRVNADDKKPVAVDRLAGAEHGFPPAGFGIIIIGCRMCAGRQAGEQQNRIAALAV